MIPFSPSAAHRAPQPRITQQFQGVRRAQDGEMPLPGECCMAVDNVRYFVSDTPGNQDATRMMALSADWMKALQVHNEGKLRQNHTFLSADHPANRALKGFQRALSLTAPPLLPKEEELTVEAPTHEVPAYIPDYAI